MRLAPSDVAADLKRNGLLAVASGGLGALLFYPFDLWFLAPFALVPLLIGLHRTETTRAAGYLALLTGWTMSLISLHWLWSIFATGMIAVCVLIALPWLLFGLAYHVLARRFDASSRGRHAPHAGLTERDSGMRSMPATRPEMILATPVLFTAMEWLRCQGWYFRFSWLQPGTAYVASQASQSTYPLVGVYGMTFLTVLVSAGLAYALLQPERARRLKALGATAGLVAVLALLFRVAWLTGLSSGGVAAGGTEPGTFTVLMVQSETEDLNWLIERTREFARARPKLIVWPELAVNDYVGDDPAILGRLQSLAREMQATLVLGCKSHVPEGTATDWLRRRAMMQAEGALYYNSALTIGSDGAVTGRYHKRHPIQFFSDGVPGPGYPVFPMPVAERTVPFGVAICYDLDFADTALSLTRNGAQLLVVPTYDARDWGPVQQMQHARLALARAAEVGRCVVRPTSSGVSQIIAPGGEQLRFIPSGDGGQMLGVVDARSYRTLYVRGMWLLPYLCVGVSVLMLLGALLKRKDRA